LRLEFKMLGASRGACATCPDEALPEVHCAGQFSHVTYHFGKVRAGNASVVMIPTAVAEHTLNLTYQTARIGSKCFAFTGVRIDR
jgi:hypothetical protein